MRYFQILAIFFLIATIRADAQTAWGRAWISAFSNSKTTPVHVVILSDSTARVDQTNSVGYGPNERANLWPNQLQTTLQEIAPGRSHGTGLLPLEANAAGFDTDVWNVSGPYSYLSGIGPYQSELTSGGKVPANGSTIQLSAGEAASLSNQYGDRLWIYWASCPDSSAVKVTIDGLSQGVFGQEQSDHCVAKRTLVYRGSLGTHKLTIGTSSGHSYLYAAEWTAGNSGVAVDNLAIGGATSYFFASSAKLAYVREIPDVGVLILALGINDFLHAVPPEIYRSNLSIIISDFHEKFPGASILIVNPYQVLSDTATNSLNLHQEAYEKVAREVAAQHSTGYLSISDKWGSFTSANARGFLTPDRVHPSDKGGKQLAQEVQRMLIE